MRCDRDSHFGWIPEMWVFCFCHSMASVFNEQPQPTFNMTTILESVRNARESGALLASSAAAIEEWLSRSFLPEWAIGSLRELVDAAEWEELNNRFFQNMTFGTGGIRGRTQSTKVTASERGGASPAHAPEHAGVGTNLLNDFNIARATIALYRYTKGYLSREGRDHEIPGLVIAHDVRHFSRHFCELCASIWSRMGGNSYIFDGPRSTPQLSFTVRYLKVHTGVVITASHNPYHDNGFKAYFEDGGQVVSPHAEGIVAEFGNVALEELPPLLEKDLSRVVVVGKSPETAYREAVKRSLIHSRMILEQKPHIVFTPIHGTGAVTSVPVIRECGAIVDVVEEQMRMDGNFPTVKSPNPENSEALSMAVAKAREVGADLLIGTDPDCDRMAVAVRNKSGDYEIFTGNMTGAILAEYRISQLKAAGLIPEQGSPRAALIKTFVTTPLQDRIAESHGLKVINTLTGFKFIGDKLQEYQMKLDEAMKAEGFAIDYDRMAPARKRELMLAHSTFYVFGGEESYGYLCTDDVRDKDGNAASLAVVEVAAYLKSQGKSLIDYLDAIYVKHGLYLETLGNVYLEGAVGAQKIRNILKSYRESPPASIGGVPVSRITDFGTETLRDADGKEIPKQDFYLVDLANGYRYAVRGSGTEPKIKFYVFGYSAVADLDSLPEAKKKTRVEIEDMRKAIEADAMARV